MNPQDHLELLRRRRSRRQFTDKPVEIEAIKRALEAATMASSGANGQPWEFVLLGPGIHRDPIRKMAEVADERFHRTAAPWMKEFFKEHDITSEKIYFDKAPWLICVFARKRLPYWMNSVWLAVGNLVNHLETEGLNTVISTPTLNRDFNKLLGVDTEWAFQAMLPVGYADPNEEVKDRPRVPVSEKTLVLDDGGLHKLDE